MAIPKTPEEASISLSNLFFASQSLRPVFKFCTVDLHTEIKIPPTPEIVAPSEAERKQPCQQLTTDLYLPSLKK